MKSKLKFVAYLGCFLILLPDAKAQQQQGQKSESVPAVKILEAKFSDKLNAAIRAPSLEAPDGHKWLILTVELTSSTEKSSMPADRIRVSDDSSKEYPAVATDYLTKKRREPIFYFFKNRGALTAAPKELLPEKIRGVWSPIYVKSEESKAMKSIGECFFEEGNYKKMNLCVTTDKETGALEVGLLKKTATVVFLFAVPALTERLHFQIAEEAKISVPLG